MELTTLLFPIMQVRKYKKNARETQQALAAFDHKVDLKQRSLGSARSSVTQSTNSKKGKMFSMESLNECLASNYDGLQIYASGLELNGENIVFLTKVLQFQKQWHSTFSRAKTFSGALKMMFPAALSIYIQLIHAATAVYPINIESPIYAKLDSIFSTAVALMASSRRGSEILIPVGNCAATPWDVATPETPDSTTDGFPMHSMPASRTNSGDNESTENLTRRLCDDRSEELEDPFANFMVPRNFDDHVFDAAFNSIKYMIWTGTWQRYMAWKRTSAAAIATAA